MTATAYYNEIDPYAAQWLRNLIAAGHIAPGIVDERSIEDVHPSDLAGFTQCHFFAGIGVWSYALRRAGWPDERPVWTGSCPCQPFSAAGQGAGFADERHLWPAFHWLIRERRPARVYGEQVASKDAEPWIDLVQDDMEGMDYAFGAVPFPAAGVGAWHLRDRLYWMADSEGERRGEARRRGGRPTERPGDGSQYDRLADSNIGASGQGCAVDGWRDSRGDAQPQPGLGGGERAGGLGHADHAGLAGRADERGDDGAQQQAAERASGSVCWLPCRDGKRRPIEPGLAPLAHGLARSMGSLGPVQQRMAVMAGLTPSSHKRARDNRYGRLHGYGNAIHAGAARIFIESTMRAAA